MAIFDGFRKRGKGIADLRNGRELLEAEIQALEEMAKHHRSPEWAWLVEKFLPREVIRLSVSRAETDPTDTKIQCGFFHTIHYIKELTSRLTMIDNTLLRKREELSRVVKAIAEMEHRVKQQQGDAIRE